jgi:S1-C subfamily serine protease
MRIVIAPESQSCREVLACLESWSRAGLTEPFCWWPVDGGVSTQVRRVDEGAMYEEPLGVALDGVPPDAVALVAFHPAADGEDFDESFPGAVEACLARLRQGVAFDPNHPVECTMIVAPALVAQPVPSRLFRARWVANVYVAPEDRVDARQFNQLESSAVLFAPHAAHALATVASLWKAVDATSHDVLRALRVQQAGAEAAPVRVVRCFSRLVDFGHLADHLAAHTFQPGEAWPNPDLARFERIADPAAVVGPIVRGYLAKHREVLGLSPFRPVPAPGPPQIKLYEALWLLFRRVAARVRRMPVSLADRTVSALHDAAAAQIERMAGGKDEVRVRRWRERRSDERSLEALIDELPTPLVAPDGPVSETWTDLRRIGFGLIDGSPLPEGVDDSALRRGDLRAVLTDPRSVVPDPHDPPPVAAAGERPRSCDPLRLDPDLMADAEGSSAPPELDAWTARHRQTPIWMIGRALADALTEARAQERGEAPVLTKDEEEAAAAELRGTRRRLARGVAVATTGAVLAQFVAFVELAIVSAVGAMFGITAAWLVAIALEARRAFVQEEKVAQVSVRNQLAHLNNGLRRAHASGDAIRLARRYDEYLDWAEIIGHFAHRPWVGERLDRVQLAGVVESRTLPAAFRVGVATPTPAHLEEVAGQVKAQLLREAWLSTLYGEVERGVGEDAPWERSGRPPHRDPAADTSEDPESPRRHLLAAVRRGDRRHLHESSVSRDLLQHIDRLTLDDIAPEVVLAPSAGNVVGGRRTDPLPPAATWFEPPKNLAALSEGLREAVARIDVIRASERDGGTGVLVDAAGLVATARHVVEGADEIAVTFADGAQAGASMALTSSTTDLALLEVSLAEARAPVPLAPDSVEVRRGDPVFTMGYLGLRTGIPILAWGVLVSIDGKIAMRDSPPGIGEFRVLQATYRSAGGASGSPIFDLAGKIVGVHCAGARDGGTYLSSAVPVAELRALLAAVRGPVHLPQSAAGRREPPARPRRAETAPSGFLTALQADPGPDAMSPDHWLRLESAQIEDVLLEPRVTNLFRPQVRDLSRGASFLEPLRAGMHRVDVARPVGAGGLASCRVDA